MNALLAPLSKNDQKHEMTRKIMNSLRFGNFRVF